MINGRIGPLKARLLGLSFLMLFVELALIRWSGSNILYLSYFSNFILLASFLGIGLGFLRADARRNLFAFAPIGHPLHIVNRWMAVQSLPRPHRGWWRH